jgi:sugar phosphate isomerase/epimerase
MDRRAFVATTATVCAGAWRPVPRARRHIERVGLQLYTVRHELERDFEGTLTRVATTGYREVEFAGYFGRTPKDVRGLLDRHGLAAPSAHVSVDTLAPDAWHAPLEAANAIGHHYLVVAWIPVEQRHTLDDYKRVGERFNQAAATARAAGIQLAYHNHDFEFATLDGQLPYDVLLAATDPQLVQLEIDLYWMVKGGQDPTHYFERWPGRVPLVHVKDSAGPPDHKMTAVGAGTIDFRRIFGHPAARIQHYFVEHDQPADAFASIQASYDYLKQLDF